jgi:hypothetical protein
MKHTLFVALLALACLSALPAPSETRFERRAQRNREIARNVVWPNHEPLLFYLRRGRRAEEWPRTYERQHDPDNIRQMAEAGVRSGRLHFYKGFGLNLEMPEIEKSRQMAELMHKLGMKVSVYVAGTMFIESFYRELPEAEQWEQRDQDNIPVPYSDTQTYRHFACPNEPAYRAYMKKVLDIAIDRLKTDEIFFDNVFLQAEPKSCRCPRCMKVFTDFLARKYPAGEAATLRFGYPDASFVKVNKWYYFNRPESLQTIDDPVLQEWTGFRTESLARACADFYDYIKAKNPKIAVGFNLKGIYGTNRIWRNAVYHPLFRGKIDFSCFDVGGMEARMEPKTGAMISEIRSYKLARTVGFTYQEGGAPLDFAVHMAFNPQKLVPGFGYAGGPSAEGAERLFTPEAEFFREYNERYYTDTAAVADVAVLRTWPSMAYSVVGTLVPTILVEQVLIQHKVPFDIISDDEIGKIGRYGAIILAGQECLSKKWVDRLTEYVRGGGTVVFTGNTADYNEFRETRAVNPLMALAERAGGAGKGKVVHIPRIGSVPAGTRGRGSVLPGDETDLEVPRASIAGGTFPATSWTLPSNHEEIFRTVAGSLPHGLSITTNAPLTTVMELVTREKSGETMVHFVNFDRARSVSSFEVRVRKAADRKVKSVTLLSPDSDDPRPLGFTEDGGYLRFTVSGLNLYAMIVIA